MAQETGIGTYWLIGTGFGLVARSFPNLRKRRPPIKAKATCGKTSMTTWTVNAIGMRR
jgi:hypothetical protein